ncbi:MAG: hypothetical protein II193_08350 [Lachnospiraceae bacterium]|nr:hypothetical protein [Lachnospiraceae bacterium]
MAMNDTGKTADLSNKIAEDLTKSTYNLFNSSMTVHYDRAAMAATDPYSVYIYDYRDIDAVAPEATVTGIRKYSNISYDVEDVSTIGREVKYDRWDHDPIWIQASDNTPDGMFIKSGYLSLKKLGLERYTVNDYRYEVTMMDPDGYAKRLDEWNKAAPDPKPITVNRQISVREVIQRPEYNSIYKDGEPTLIMTKPPIYGSKTINVQLTEYEYPNDTRGPKPVPDYDVKEIYTPTDLSVLDDAISEICRVRSYYGASQNRLEHTYKNNSNVHENLTYAESRIRDTDMAKEMVNNSTLNILKQAGLSMLSQANQANQGVLALLQ